MALFRFLYYSVVVILHMDVYSSGRPVLLLHGMAGSGRYWNELIGAADTEYQFIVLDLLGFGRSPKPTDSSYDYADHLDSIIETLRTIDTKQPFIVVGHSMGALLALRLAAEHPELVEKLVLCGLPYYPDIATARKDITRDRLIWRLAYYGRTSRILCTLWCSWLRPVTKYAAPLYLPRMPRTAAEDTLLHTWQSYAQSLDHIVEHQDVGTDLADVKCPMTFLYGQSDAGGQYLGYSGLIDGKDTIRAISYPDCSHQLPLEQPQAVIRSITENL